MSRRARMSVHAQTREFVRQGSTYKGEQQLIDGDMQIKQKGGKKRLLSTKTKKIKLSLVSQGVIVVLLLKSWMTTLPARIGSN